jgi:hypothetical protein
MQFTEQGGPDEALLAWLAGRSSEELAEILENRPDALREPWPRRLGSVAERLSRDASIERAGFMLTAPAFQLLAAVQIYGTLNDEYEISVPALAKLLEASENEVNAAVKTLSGLALAWITDGTIRIPEGLRADGSGHYGLGQAIGPLLSRLTVAGLQEACHAVGLRADGRKSLVAAQLLEFYRDADKVRELVANAPDGVAEFLQDFVWNGPELEVDLGTSRYYYGRAGGRADEPLLWALDRLLLFETHDGNAHMPLEVGWALRGADYRLPFTPTPPAVPTAPVAAEQIAAETSAAALRLLDRVTTVLEKAAAEPLPLLKSGGVGTRVIKKLAKETGGTVQEIGLALDLAGMTGLLTAEEPPPLPASRGRSRKPPPAPPAGLIPSDEFARWRARSSGLQLRTLLEAWWRDPKVPGEESIDFRPTILRLLTELGPGVGVADVEAFTALAVWHIPAIDPALVADMVAQCLAEATLVGAVAAAAAGPLTPALLTGTGITKVTDELVAGAWATALFGTDLTAIVTGPPSTELTALLDRVADRESQGSASTWRFSPASVRRAFDNGDTPETLTRELGAVARGELPQPLAYLINDVARRHGEMQVLDVRSIVVSEVPGLLTEIAAHRKLAKFDLRVVAPTVLTSSADAATTLAALRDAGYSPVQRAADGTIAVRAAAAKPEAVEDGDFDPFETPEKVLKDPLEHAARLLKEPYAQSRALQRGALLRVIPGNHNQAWMRIIWQLETGFPVWVVYDDPEKGRYKLLISNPELHGDELDVWSHDPPGYRRLKISRIIPGESGL